MRHDEILANIDYFIEHYQIEEVCLSGGEPTIHPDLLTSLQHIRKKGLRAYLHSNGIRFHDSNFADEHSPYLDRVLIGFSFHNEALCAELTGTGKDFDKRLVGIRNLVQREVPVRTNTVIVKSNLTSLPDISKIIASLKIKKALFTLPFFFEITADQVERFVPTSFSEVKPHLEQAIRILEEKDIKVSLQGLPPCKLGDLDRYAEVDPDRAFVDSQCQLDEHRFLFSGMLGYQQVDACEGCSYSNLCWGFPQPGALGELGEALALPR